MPGKKLLKGGSEAKRAAALRAATEKKARLAAERAQAIETKLRLLEWRKHTNETQIRGVIKTTRKMVAHDQLALVAAGQTRAAQHSVWAQSIIEDELQRPLEVSDDFLAQYREQEQRDLRREAGDETRHQRSMDSLQHDIARKDELAQRAGAYKEKRACAEAEAVRRRQLLSEAGDDEEAILQAEASLREPSFSAKEAAFEQDLLALIAAGEA